jgi:hyperosmotically inducible protein
MKKLILCSLIAVSAAYLPIAMADTDAHPGTYVKDSVITAKVKSKLAAKHVSTLTNIKVDTDAQGVVWLSGKAPTRDARDLAIEITKNTDCVVSVHDDIVIEP